MQHVYNSSWAVEQVILANKAPQRLTFFSASPVKWVNPPRDLVQVEEGIPRNLLLCVF